MPRRIKTHQPATKQSRADYLKAYDVERKAKYPWRKWYNTARWRLLRLFILDRDPWCKRCDAKGRAVPSDTVNHIHPHKGDEALFWREDNLEGVCASCHSSDIQKEERAKYG